MGHTRLGAIPKIRKWNELVQQVAGIDRKVCKYKKIIVHGGEGDST